MEKNKRAYMKQIFLPAFVVIILFVDLQSAFATRGTVIDFDWIMQDRFLDTDGDGIVDYNYSPEHVNPPSGYVVHFNACASTNRISITSYIWEVRGTGITWTERSCRTTQPISLQEGIYQVTLTVTTKNWQTISITKPVRIEDLLIVSIGDSLAAGEGNPHPPELFETPDEEDRSPTPRPNWKDTPCHRSANSYSAQAALEMERSDPHTSVTFLHFACTGATIEQGLIGSYAPQGTQIPAQTWQVTKAICRIETSPTEPVCLDASREVDILMIGVGINDIGFSGLIAQCLVINGMTGCHQDLGVNTRLNSDLSRLPDLYTRLANDISKRFRVSDVLITEYPDPTHDEQGNYCDTFGGLFSTITREEAKWAYEQVLTRLNREVQNAAAIHGWTYVGGVVPQFITHGYCAESSRWFRTVEDSIAIQRDRKGALHPNTDGHLAIKNSHIQSIHELAARRDRTDIQLTGDFMGLGRDQVLFINTDGNFGRVQIVDFSQGVPAQRRYLEWYGDSNVLDGWHDVFLP
jgi:hypothetical protein